MPGRAPKNSSAKSARQAHAASSCVVLFAACAHHRRPRGPSATAALTIAGSTPQMSANANANARKARTRTRTPTTSDPGDAIPACSQGSSHVWIAGSDGSSFAAFLFFFICWFCKTAPCLSLSASTVSSRPWKPREAVLPVVHERRTTERPVPSFFYFFLEGAPPLFAESSFGFLSALMKDHTPVPAEWE